MHNDALIERLLKPLMRQEYQDLAHWHAEFNQQTQDVPESIQRAIIGGRNSVCVGFAFAAGYQSAIESLFQLESRELASFCVSESKGNHPKVIQTTLAKSQGLLTLTGHKTFVSGGCDAQRLFVACKDLEASTEQPFLKVVSLPANHTGIAVTAMPPLPFVPEVSHGQVLMDQVTIHENDVLSGDGYLKYIKPFRTCEDIHVSAAVCAYLFAEGMEAKWPSTLLEQYLALISAFTAIEPLELAAPATHLCLAGLRSQLHSLIKQSEIYFEQGNKQGYQAWQRDKALLSIAAKAHDVRTEKAWKSITA